MLRLDFILYNRVISYLALSLFIKYAFKHNLSDLLCFR